MTTGFLERLEMPKSNKGSRKPKKEKEVSAAVLKLREIIGDDTSGVRIGSKRAKQLAELTRLDEDGLENVAQAFEKHFGATLENLVIAANEARLKRLRQEAESRS